MMYDDGKEEEDSCGVMVGIEYYYTRLATRWNLCGQDFPRKGHYLVIFTTQDLLPYGDMQ